jgi:hypothetical protein
MEWSKIDSLNSHEPSVNPPAKPRYPSQGGSFWMISVIEPHSSRGNYRCGGRVRVTVNHKNDFSHELIVKALPQLSSNESIPVASFF